MNFLSYKEASNCIELWLLSNVFDSLVIRNLMIKIWVINTLVINKFVINNLANGYKSTTRWKFDTHSIDSAKEVFMSHKGHNPLF